MYENDLNILLKDSKIQAIKRTCNLIMVSIIDKQEKLFCLHSECFFRVYHNKRNLLCSEDMYIKGRKTKRRFKWDKPSSSLFDDCIFDNSKLIIGINISDIKFFDNELRIFLENGVVVEIIPNTTRDDVESYRLFSKDIDYIVI